MLRPLLEEGKKRRRLGIGEGELLFLCRRYMEEALYRRQSDRLSKSSYISEIAQRD